MLTTQGHGIESGTWTWRDGQMRQRERQTNFQSRSRTKYHRADVQNLQEKTSQNDHKEKLEYLEALFGPLLHSQLGGCKASQKKFGVKNTPESEWKVLKMTWNIQKWWKKQKWKWKWKKNQIEVEKQIRVRKNFEWNVKKKKQTKKNNKKKDSKLPELLRNHIIREGCPQTDDRSFSKVRPKTSYLPIVLKHSPDWWNARFSCEVNFRLTLSMQKYEFLSKGRDLQITFKRIGDIQQPDDFYLHDNQQCGGEEFDGSWLESYLQILKQETRFFLFAIL